MEKLVEVHLLKRILKEFPRNMKFCFAYGSAAFKQMNNQTGNMLDLIFVVRNANKWHAENMARNPSHYAQPLKFFGHNTVASVQEKWGAKVYYNTLIKTSDGQNIKYGVISEVSLIEDLLDWNNLYIAGRLHKPVKVLVEPDEQSQLPTALVQNLHSAIHAALLLLPQHFTEMDLYKTIANLSYAGDFRMTFGENKEKVNNIVVPQLQQFKQLYAPILKHFDRYIEVPSLESASIMCHQDTSAATKIHHLNHLPRTPQVALVREWSEGPRSNDTEDCLRAIAYDPECSQLLDKCLKEITWRSSVTQSLKGIVTAGLFKSVKYSTAKIVKMMQKNSRKNSFPKQESDKVERLVDTVVKKETQPKETDKRIE